MAAAPEVLAAFQSGAGVSGVTAHDVLVVVLAAVVLLWLAAVVAGIGSQTLDQRLTQDKAGRYVVRAVVLVMMVVFYLLG